MNLAALWQLLPFADRLSKAAVTIERLEKDPDVQDVLKLVQEIGAILAKEQASEQHG